MWVPDRLRARSPRPCTVFTFHPVSLACLKVMNALPTSLKLLTIPTYIVLIPQQRGGVGQANLEAAVSEMMQLAYNVRGGCPGVDFSFDTNAQSNQLIAEGEAEYFTSAFYFDEAGFSARDCRTSSPLVLLSRCAMVLCNPTRNPAAVHDPAGCQ